MHVDNLLIDLFGHADRAYISEKDLMVHILKELKAMALDTSKLTAAVAKLATDVETLVAAHTDPAAQGAVDTVTANVAALSAKVEAALAPPPAA
jgi:hypothetical protein